MYQVGDTVVCGSNGVCTILEIGPLSNMGKAQRKRNYYTMRPYFDTSGRVYMPVDCDESSIRPTLTRDEVTQLMSEVDTLSEISISDEKLRETEYKNAVNSCDPRMLIRAIKTMYFRKRARLESGKKNTAIDERYFRVAEQRLYEEVALALGIERDAARENIRGYIEKL